MGAWYLSLAVSLFLILIGMTIHWTVMLAGVLLLFVPMVSMLFEHRRRRLGGEKSKASADRADEQEGGGKS